MIISSGKQICQNPGRHVMPYRDEKYDSIEFAMAKNSLMGYTMNIVDCVQSNHLVQYL